MSYYFFFLINILPKLWWSKPIVNFFLQTFGEQLPLLPLPHPMLGNLSLLAIESDLMDDISNNDVIDYLATNKPKKIALP